MNATDERSRILSENLEFTLTSWSKQKGLDPIVVERGKGVYLYDYNGKRYIDFSSGLMNVNIGHGDTRVG
ncbi:MAG: aminotransferase class III-fold pyridoxal phosphate-dependent enzyme [Bacteroidota bacterium]